jgi:hypothetical protein
VSIFVRAETLAPSHGPARHAGLKFGVGGKPLAVRNPRPPTTRGFIPAHKEKNMKQDARKNSHRRKRQKRRLAMRKYMAEKKSKAVVA